MTDDQDVTWVEEIPLKKLDFTQCNPHYKEASLSDYLQFYQFDFKHITTYRCQLTETDRSNIFVQIFTPNNPKGTVLFVHGYLDHTGGLSATVNVLLKQSYEVVAVDLPGHGLSEGDRGDIQDFNYYVDAVQSGLTSAEPYRSGGALYGLGHSTGGAVLFHGTSEEVLPLRALMLAGPLYHPYQWKWVRMILPVLSKGISKKKRRFKQNSSDERYLDFLKQDPLQVKELPISWLIALTEWQQRILNCSKVNIPVYLLQGTNDTTVQWQDNVEFFKDKCPFIQVALFEGAGHQLLNETASIQKLVFKRIASFINGENEGKSTLLSKR
ncbi:alpha/beta hydrolase [Alteribacter populi]|uniref:alpha/beta hydrolase n=1 Tax=Alteribacter populi TaxID=2011011 RepID=UPI000BBAF16A|nr:alpha/beta hydrolase [Alteribacter populi]